MNKITARQIVNEIIEDIIDRNGLGNAFEEIDEDVQKEIEKVWIEIILSGANNP